MQTFFNNRGVSLVMLIVIMLGIGLIGGAVASIMMSKQKSYPFALNSFKAYEIANAGAEFAIRYYTDNSTLPTTAISFGGGSFTLTNQIIASNLVISQGTYQNITRQVRIANFTTYATTASTGDVTFDNPADMASFVPMESQSGQAIVVNTTTGVISLGQGATETFGAVWYGGNNAAGNCVNGSCDFANGFRAYYVFQFAKGSTGDGFTFAIINGTSNTVSSVGGDTSMGELMAYGGDSRKYDSSSPYANDISLFADHKGLGVQPPKFATEFDIYFNACGTVCSGAGSRCDDTADNHMAYVFWGNNSTMGCAPEDVSIYLRWMPSMVYAANTIVHPVTSNGYIYRTLNAGTSGTTEPAWPAGKGGTVTESGGLQWKEASWRQNTNYVSGDIIAPTTVSCSFDPTAENGHLYRESRSGTRRSCVACGGSCSEPDWTGCTGSGTCNDNAARWQDAGSIVIPGNSRTYDDNRHVDVGTGGNTGSSAGTGPTNTTSGNSYYSASSIPAWSASTNYAAGYQVVPTTSNGYFYAAQTAGTSGSSQPAWPTTINGTVTDGTVTWVPVNSYYSIPVWTASTTYYTGDQVKPAANNGYVYVAQAPPAGGTSSGSQPAWPTSGTVTDGTVTWAPASIINQPPAYFLANTNDLSAANPKYAFRMEVTRNSGARTYRIKTWIKSCTDSTKNCDMHTNGTFGNVASDYIVDSPKLDRTITLDATYNTAFTKFLFGWTVAAGGATQIADVRKFRVSFKP